MEYITTDSIVDIFNDQIEDGLSISNYDLRKSSCFKEIEENLRNSVESFEVEDDLSGQDPEEIMQCIAEVYDDSVIYSARDLRVKMKIENSDEEIEVDAYLFDAADHSDDPSYETKIVVENEFWTLEEFKKYIAQDFDDDDEEEIELALEEALDQFADSIDVPLDDYTVNFCIEKID